MSGCPNMSLCPNMSGFLSSIQNVRISVQYIKCPVFIHSLVNLVCMYLSVFLVLRCPDVCPMSVCMSHVRPYFHVRPYVPCPDFCSMSVHMSHVWYCQHQKKKFRGTDTYTHICASVILCVSVPMCAFIMCAYCACVPFNNLCMCPPMSCL